MVSKSFILIASALLLFGCGGGNSVSVGGNVPGDGEKQLKFDDEIRVANFNGDLGDAMGFTEMKGRIAPQSSSMISSYENRPKGISRSEERKALRDSSELDRCRVTREGNTNSNYALVEVLGRRCRVEMFFEQQRKKASTTSSSRRREFDIVKSFKSRNSSVRTSIISGILNGKVSQERQFAEGSTTTVHAGNFRIEGDSEEMGRFVYDVNENYKRVNFDRSVDESLFYDRVDTVEFERDLKAVFFKRLRVERGVTKELRYYLNGREISDSIYYGYIKEFDRQVGLEKYN